MPFLINFLKLAICNFLVLIFLLPNFDTTTNLQIKTNNNSLPIPSSYSISCVQNENNHTEIIVTIITNIITAILSIYSTWAAVKKKFCFCKSKKYQKHKVDQFLQMVRENKEAVAEAGGFVSKTDLQVLEDRYKTLEKQFTELKILLENNQELNDLLKLFLSRYVTHLCKAKLSYENLTNKLKLMLSKEQQKQLPEIDEVQDAIAAVFNIFSSFNKYFDDCIKYLKSKIEVKPVENQRLLPNNNQAEEITSESQIVFSKNSTTQNSERNNIISLIEMEAQIKGATEILDNIEGVTLRKPSNDTSEIV